MEEGKSMRGTRGKGKSVNLPMSLKFNGKSNWKAFYAKFSRYAEVSEWTEGECRVQLCWYMDGKASEYYALLVERNQDMTYKDLLIKKEKRFGLRELPETAQVQFSDARHTPDEFQEDRVLSLATRAFRNLPENHMYQQAVVRFCQGAVDEEAGSYASKIRPHNIDEAIDKMQWHQHNHQAIYGRPLRKEVKQLSPGAYNGRLDGGEVSLRQRSEQGRGDESEERDGGGAIGTGEGSGEDQVQRRSTLGSNGGLREVVLVGIERHHEVCPPDGRTNRDAATVWRWGISRRSAQDIWDPKLW